LMSSQRLIIFQHDSLMGDVPAQDQFSRVAVRRTTASDTPPRDFSDYNVLLDGSPLSRLQTVVSV